MIQKTIVCLANSRKLHGRCVAGRVMEDETIGPWIRPVSSRQNGEVSEYERQYVDGRDPKVLDIVSVPLERPQPHGYQQENWLISPDHTWENVGTLNWETLPRFSEPAGPLWSNESSTYNGRNDRIALEAAAELSTSLRLVQVPELRLQVFSPGEAFGNTKRRVQARFTLFGDDYWLWVTDPVVERDYLAREDGCYHLADRFLTISLGEPHEGYCYKLVATVIGPAD